MKMLYGFKPNERKFYALNHILLICFFNVLPPISTFEVAFRKKLQIEKQIAIQNKTCRI